MKDWRGRLTVESPLSSVGWCRVPGVRRWGGWLLAGVVLLQGLGLGLGAGAAEFDASHGRWDGVLKRFVADAKVDYAGLQQKPAELDRYLGELSAVGEGAFRVWTEAERLAFLCNAYNAFTVRLVLDHYPLRSIKEIGGVLRGPWDQPVVRLFGRVLTLNALEHEVMRKQYAEPRLHFALVCAARGCPPLRAEAYVGARLEVQLADQARRFLAETNKNRIVLAQRTVYLSPIFKWYEEDFVRQGGTVLAAIRPYWPADMAVKLEDDFVVRYTDYDWSLNDREARSAR